MDSLVTTHAPYPLLYITMSSNDVINPYPANVYITMSSNDVINPYPANV